MRQGNLVRLRPARPAGHGWGAQSGPVQLPASRARWLHEEALRPLTDPITRLAGDVIAMRDMGMASKRLPLSVL